MNCDESIELLPWFLNGTLGEGEYDEIRRHLATCERCRAALEDTREAWTIFDQHLPSQTLVALAYGEAPRGIDPALAERHLASCPQCAAELELARMSRRLEEDDKVAVFPGSRSLKTDAARDGGSRTWRYAALAASFAGLVAASGWFFEARQAGNYAEQLAQRPAPVQARPTAPAPAPPVRTGSDATAAQIAEMRTQVEEARRQAQQTQDDLKQAQSQMAQMAELSRKALAPEINAQVVTGPPEVVRDGSGTEAREAVLPSDQPALLTLPTESKGAVRTLEIVDGGGKVLWTGAGLRSDEDLEYKVQFRPGFLKPGHYTIRLYETVNGRREPREKYAIRVQ